MKGSYAMKKSRFAVFACTLLLGLAMFAGPLAFADEWQGNAQDYVPEEAYEYTEPTEAAPEEGAPDAAAQAPDAAANAPQENAPATPAPEGVVPETPAPAPVAPQDAITTSDGDEVLQLGNDCVWAGERLDLSGASIANDLLAAGRDITVEKGQLGGSIRAAGQEIRVTDTTVTQGITVAGETMEIENTQTEYVAAAGRIVSFEGTCKQLRAYASEVTINGTVEGDAEIGADSIRIGPNARITGTLHVTSDSDPVIAEGAQVANVEVTHEDVDSTNAGEAQEIAFSALSGFTVLFAILGILSTILVAVLAEWLFGRHTAAAAEMVRDHTGAHLATGILGMLLSPLALILMCVFIITLPVAGISALALLALALAAKGFAGASVFRYVFPKFGRFTCALAGGAIMGVLGAIPVIGGIAKIGAYAYTLGYVLQNIYRGLRPTDDESVERDVYGSAPKPPVA